MYNLQKNISVIVPVHKEIKKGTSSTIKKADITLSELEQQPAVIMGNPGEVIAVLKKVKNECMSKLTFYFHFV